MLEVGVVGCSSVDAVRFGQTTWPDAARELDGRDANGGWVEISSRHQQGIVPHPAASTHTHALIPSPRLGRGQATTS